MTTPIAMRRSGGQRSATSDVVSRARSAMRRWRFSLRVLGRGRHGGGVETRSGRRRRSRRLDDLWSRCTSYPTPRGAEPLSTAPRCRDGVRRGRRKTPTSSRDCRVRRVDVGGIERTDGWNHLGMEALEFGGQRGFQNDDCGRLGDLGGYQCDQSAHGPSTQDSVVGSAAARTAALA